MKNQSKNIVNPVYTILAIIAGISLLIIALATAYYLVVYLPKKDIQKLDYEKKQKQEQLDTNKQQYDTCLLKAAVTYHENWLSRCKANNIRVTKNENGNDTCFMLDTVSKPVTDNYNTNKEACLKIYQAN